MMRRLLTAGIFILSIAGCVTQTTSPIGVAIVLVSSSTYEPYSLWELSDPATHSLIQDCVERVGKKCGQKQMPGDIKKIFDRTIDDHVLAYVTVTGVQPGKTYEFEYSFFDADGALSYTHAESFNMPETFRADQKLIVWIRWTPDDEAPWKLGQWRIEIAIDGTHKAKHFFDVLEDQNQARDLARIAPKRDSTQMFQHTRR